jgi:ABC-2 type transport system permease protein
VQLANSQARNAAGGGGLDTAAHWLRWTPPGLLAQALAALPDRNWTVVTLGTGAGTLTLATAIATWTWTLERSTKRPEGRSGRGGKRTDDASASRETSLFPRAMPFLPRSRAGAVAARELRGFRRDPRRAAMLVPAIAVPIVWALSTHPAGTSFTRAAPLFALAAVVFTNRFSANLFGIDGSAYWSHVAVGSDPTPDVYGKQLAISIIITPIVVAIAVALGIASHALAVALLTVALLPAVLGLHLGLGAVASAHFPQAIPDRGNPFGTLSGQGCASALAVIALLALELGLMLPAAIGLIIAARQGPQAAPFIILAAWAEGYAVWRMGSRHAGEYLRFRLPELLAAIDPRQA